MTFLSLIDVRPLSFLIERGDGVAIKTGFQVYLGVLIMLAFGCSIAVTRPGADARFARQRLVESNDPGCEASTLVSTGGAFPKDPKTLTIRSTGYTNFELVYNGQIILLNAHFNRGSMFPPLGFTAADVKRAHVILIGHGPLDHMSDAASVGARTGALVVGTPVTTDKFKTQPIDPKQIRTVTGRGGELLEFPGFKVEPILADLNGIRILEQVDEFDREVAALGSSGKFMSFLDARSKEEEDIPLSEARTKRGL